MIHRQDRRSLLFLVIWLIKDLNMIQHISERIHKPERNKTLYFLASNFFNFWHYLVCIKSPLLSVQSPDKLRPSWGQESSQTQRWNKKQIQLKINDCFEKYLANLFNFCFSISTKQGLRALMCLWTSLQPNCNPHPLHMHTQTHSLHPTYPPGDSVSAWTSVQGWQLQMLLTAVKLRGSSSHSKVQMFLF